MLSKPSFMIFFSRIILVLFIFASSFTLSKKTDDKHVYFFPNLSLTEDTVHVHIRFNDSLARSENKLSDSLTYAYIKIASKGNTYSSLAKDAKYYKYTGYDLGTYRIGSDVIGQFVVFKPEYNAYHTLYLFQKDNNGTIIRNIELAYGFGEEGVDAWGSSLLIRNDNYTNIYIKRYWANYVGSDADLLVLTDDILFCTLSTSSFVVSFLDSVQCEKWEEIFWHRERGW